MARALRLYRLVLIRAAGAFYSSYLLGSNVTSEEQIRQHTLACLLARVAGRSPLEYLSYEERQSQQRRIIRLMDRIPRTMTDLIAAMVVP